MTRRRLLWVGSLLGAGLLVGIVIGWLLALRDVRSVAGIDAVRGIPGSTRLEVTYTAGHRGCADPGGVTVKELSAEIRLTASTINRDVRALETTACPTIGIPVNRTVHLAAPLGDRTVIDTSRSQNAALRVRAP